MSTWMSSGNCGVMCNVFNTCTGSQCSSSPVSRLEWNLSSFRICCNNTGTMIHFDNNNHGDSYSALTTISTTCFTVAIHVQIKSSVKMDSITLATEYVLIATIFKHMLLGNSHITLYTHRKPYSTPGTNTIMIGSVHARKHTPTHTHTYILV